MKVSTPMVPDNCAAHECRHAFHKRYAELLTQHAEKMARMGFFERWRYRGQLKEQANFELRERVKPQSTQGAKPSFFGKPPIIH